MEQNCSIIYAISINLPEFDGLVKISQVNASFDCNLATIPDNSKKLDEIVRNHIDSYINQYQNNTHPSYKIIYTTIAITSITHKNFGSFDVYNYLRDQGIYPFDINRSMEWFSISAHEAINAIKAVKNQ